MSASSSTSLNSPRFYTHHEPIHHPSGTPTRSPERVSPRALHHLVPTTAFHSTIAPTPSNTPTTITSVIGGADTQSYIPAIRNQDLEGAVNAKNLNALFIAVGVNFLYSPYNQEYNACLSSLDALELHSRTDRITVWLRTHAAQLQEITELDLSNRELSSLPGEISYFKNLKNLNLSNNQLFDLPEELETLTHLKELFIDKNCFTILPSVVYKLTNLTQLSLTHNRVSEFANDLIHLTKLKSLNFKYNSFTKIPIDLLSRLPTGCISQYADNLVTSQTSTVTSEHLMFEFDEEGF